MKTHLPTLKTKLLRSVVLAALVCVLTSLSAHAQGYGIGRDSGSSSTTDGQPYRSLPYVVPPTTYPSEAEQAHNVLKNWSEGGEVKQVPGPADATASTTLKQRATQARRDAADHKAKSDELLRAMDSTSDLARKAGLARQSIEALDKSHAAERRADALEAQADALGTPPPPVVAPPLKLRSLDAAQREKTDKILKQLAFKKGDSLVQVYFGRLSYVGSVLSSVITEPGVDNKGLIVFDMTIQFQKPEAEYTSNPSRFTRPSANPRYTGQVEYVEPRYSGPLATESLRVFIQSDQAGVAPERIEPLGESSGFCNDIIEARLRRLDMGLPP